MFAVARFQRLAVSKFAGISKKSLSTIKFSQSHEYIKVVGDIGTVGITQHAADALGDVVYVELPAKGTQYTAGSSFGSVESVKAASDVYAPVSGEVIEVNEGLGDTPSLVNESPLEKGWFIKLKLSNAGKAEFTKLLDQAAYEKHVEESAH